MALKKTYASHYLTAAAAGPGYAAYIADAFGDLPAYGNSGDQCFVIATNKVYFRSGGAWVEPSVSAAVTYTDFTKDLGAARRDGTFDITGLAGLTADKNVLITQTAKAIASKGNARDEPEMDFISVTGYVVDATTIRAFWNCRNVVVGTYAFAYLVSA